MTLGDDIEKVLGEHMADWQLDLLKMGMITEVNTDPIAKSSIDVLRYIRGYMPISRELLDEINGTATPYCRKHAPRAPWHRRARWRWQAWRHITGVRIGSLIAGFDLSHNYDYDD